MRTGVVTGMDGSMALLKWCNHERRVPVRELMPLKEFRDQLTDGDTDIDDVEVIPEIIPARQVGPVRKGVEIIPSWTSIQVERELRERPRLSDVLSDESDHLPKYKVFTDSEGEMMRKEEKERKNKPEVVIEERPKLRRPVRLTLKTGEIVRGKVSHIEKTTRNWFFVNDGKEKYRPIDLTTVEEWLYDD